MTSTFNYGGHTFTLETGRVARQAAGAVIASCGETVVLCTVAAASSKEPRGFLPLTVNYTEKMYAGGKIPGGYFKREGRPTERETLISRLIDRPVRPLFPKGFGDEVQLICMVMSLDPAVDPDIVAMIGGSAALAISGLPFQGPIGAARVGYKAGEYVLNPSWEERTDSELELMVAGTSDAILMVESQANQLSEEVMLGAVMYGHEQMQTAIDAINQLVAEVQPTAWEWTAPAELPEADVARVLAAFESDVVAAFGTADKQARTQALREIHERAVEAFSADNPEVAEDQALDAQTVKKIISTFEKQHVRQSILAGNPRIDGRDTTTVRQVDAEVSVMPRTHGSALFTRGETQAIVVATLGTDREAQRLDGLDGVTEDNFMLHYNFPPYCVGEVGFMSGPKRREIGHGRLARRAIEAVLPSADEWPYVMRVVSEITESNGSSSMASVCGTILALMDAGVPIKAPVAGIAMGLIKEDDQVAVLTDILGDEDHLGDMDFKVAGTADGVTALQMDIKIGGITEAIMQQALKQARDARVHILERMNSALEQPREEVSTHAPRFITMKINTDKIRDVIGRGGATIREITETHNVTIDISDEGVVKIASVNGEDGEAAKARIEELTAEVEPGTIYTGKVVKVLEFGAFVSLIPGTDGFLHISQISAARVHDINDVIKEGDEVTVKVLEIDRQGRVRVSKRALEEDGADQES